MHVCIVLPWIDIRAMAAAWVSATRGAAEGQGFDLKTVRAKGAAGYVAAYVTASALALQLSPDVAAAWVRSTYGRRLVHTSRRFWLPAPERQRCDCGSCAAPYVALRETSPPDAPPVDTRAGPVLELGPPAPLAPLAERSATLERSCRLGGAPNTPRP